MKKHAFTLIELLMVIVVIGILLGLLSAAIRRSMHEGLRKRELADLRTLSSACRVFRHEYGKWPLAGGDVNQASGSYSYPGNNNNSEVLRTLDPDQSTVNSVKKIRFINIGDYVVTSNNVVSPLTGRQYLFKFDLDNDACDISTNVP